MNVEQKVKQIVESIGGLSYEFNDWTVANVKFDTKKLPVCLNVLPISGILSNKNGNFRDYVNAFIAFVDKTEADAPKKNRASFDFEGEANEPTVERMKTFARKFIMAVNDSGMFEPLPQDIRYQVVYDQLDVNLTGVVLQIQLKELQGVCIR